MKIFKKNTLEFTVVAEYEGILDNAHRWDVKGYAIVEKEDPVKYFDEEYYVGNEVFEGKQYELHYYGKGYDNVTIGKRYAVVISQNEFDKLKVKDTSLNELKVFALCQKDNYEFLVLPDVPKFLENTVVKTKKAQKKVKQKIKSFRG